MYKRQAMATIPVLATMRTMVTTVEMTAVAAMMAAIMAVVMTTAATTEDFDGGESHE